MDVVGILAEVVTAGSLLSDEIVPLIDWVLCELVPLMEAVLEPDDTELELVADVDKTEEGSASGALATLAPEGVPDNPHACERRAVHWAGSDWTRTVPQRPDPIVIPG